MRQLRSSPYAQPALEGMYVCMYVCMFVCMFVGMYVHTVCMYVCVGMWRFEVYVYMQDTEACTYVMYACIYVCTSYAQMNVLCMYV